MSLHSKDWPCHPTIYEINTWVWLTELSEKYGTFIELGDIPSSEWDAIADLGFDAVWLMGVWERSPKGISIANRNQRLVEDFRRALPDYLRQDNVGSPYCVRSYTADQLLGGPGGLAIARDELARRGVRLLLDFVSNHVAPDHPWVAEHPYYFIRGDADDLRRDPASYLAKSGCVFACGRDPFFPAWPDVLQLNAFDSGLRQAVLETIAEIAEQCDGIRCDMAALPVNSIFERTWGCRAGRRPQTEFWSSVIPAIKHDYPDFLFIAEAYWDKEWELQQQGFDFCYDKRLYDRLEHCGAEDVRLHLCADSGYQDKLVRFVENHDEPRAAAAFPAARGMAVAVTMATLPGARLFHEGQIEGRKVRLPVFLGRRPTESEDRELATFYRRLLKTIKSPAFHDGCWKLCERSGWPDNSTFQNLVAWTWVKEDDRRMVVINLSDQPAQARIHVPWNHAQGDSWRLRDTLSGAVYERDGDEICTAGLYVELGPWNYHLFQCRRIRYEIAAAA